MNEDQIINCILAVEVNPSRHSAIKSALVNKETTPLDFSREELAVIIRFGVLNYEERNLALRQIGLTPQTSDKLMHWNWKPLVQREYTWLPTKYTNHVKELRLKSEFLARSKNLNLDMFSYKIFQDYCSKLRKPLPGTEVSRYLDQLGYTQNTEQRNITALYRNILWEHSSKSEGLAKRLSETHRTSDIKETVTTYYTGNTYKEDTVFVLNNYHFVRIASDLSLKVPSDFNRNYHQTITGIVKAPTHNITVNDLIYKITLLDAYIPTLSEIATQIALEAHKQTLIASLKLTSFGNLINTINEQIKVTTAILESLQNLKQETL